MSAIRIENLRALFVPHTFRYDYFVGFLKSARDQMGWQVGVICPEQSRKAYVDAAGREGRFFFQPDFSLPAGRAAGPGDRAKIVSLIEDCERTSAISVNRILLAGERDIGRGYSRDFYYWPENSLAKKALAEPDTDHVVVERMFEFVDDIFETFDPEIVVSGATSAPVHFVTSLIAERRGVPFLINRRSKVHSNRCYWTLDRGMLSDLTRAAYRTKADENAPPSDAARAYLKRFAETPEVVSYIRKHWISTAAGENWWAWHRQCALRLAAQVAHAVKGSKSQPPAPAWPRLVEFYRTAYLRLRQQKMLKNFDDSELEAMKYIYFPFHKEPELAINVQAYPWHNQKNTVNLLSALLPKGYKLLVREHRGTWGRRPTTYLKSLNRYPGVVVVDSFDPQFKYIRNADLIITDNGSTGWEGLLLKRPVITLHENFYDAPALTTHVTEPAKLNQAIIRLLRDPPPIDEKDYERRLGWFIDAEWETTLPDDDHHHAESFRFIEALLSVSDRDESAPLSARAGE